MVHRFFFRDDFCSLASLRRIGNRHRGPVALNKGLWVISFRVGASGVIYARDGLKVASFLSTVIIQTIFTPIFPPGPLAQTGKEGKLKACMSQFGLACIL